MIRLTLTLECPAAIPVGPLKRALKAMFRQLGIRCISIKPAQPPLVENRTKA